MCSSASRNVNYRSTELLWFSFITLLLLLNKSNHITKSFLWHQKKNYEGLIVSHHKNWNWKREIEKAKYFLIFILLGKNGLFRIHAISAEEKKKDIYSSTEVRKAASIQLSI